MPAFWHMRNSVVLVAAIGLLGLAGFLLRHHLGDAGTTPARELATTSSARKPSTARNDAAPAPAASSGTIAVDVASHEAATPNYKSRLRASNDIWTFAEGILPAAKSGDPEAQYYLSRALKYCEDEYRFYFIRPDKRRTLDEAMQWASTRVGLKPEDARRVFERCARLRETAHPFGTPGEWLSASTKGGFELATMDSATQLMLDALHAHATDPAAMRDEAKRMALQALRSKNPEVIFNMSDLVSLFEDTDKGLGRLAVWRLAACLRGYDCGQDSEWYQFFCRFDANCQPYETGIDSIRRRNSEDLEQIERAAKDVNARLDADDFDWFGP